MGIDPTGGAVSGALVDALYPNRPNPFNPRTSLRYSLAHPGPAKIVIYDVAGRAVRTLHDAPLAAGEHTLTWDLASDDGRAVPAGLYFVRASLRGGVHTQRLIVVR